MSLTNDPEMAGCEIGDLQETIAELRAERDAKAAYITELVKAKDEAGDAIAELRAALGVVLDQVDFTSGACRMNEMVGALLTKDVIVKARLALGRCEEKR